MLEDYDAGVGVLVIHGRLAHLFICDGTPKPGLRRQSLGSQSCGCFWGLDASWRWAHLARTLVGAKVDYIASN